MPSNETIYNPISKKQIDLGKTDQYRWSTEFISLLKQKRKVALRLGKLSIHTPYILPHSKIKKLCNGSLEWKDITEDDLKLLTKQLNS